MMMMMTLSRTKQIQQLELEGDQRAPVQADKTKSPQCKSSRQANAQSNHSELNKGEQGTEAEKHEEYERKGDHSNQKHNGFNKNHPTRTIEKQ